MSEVGAPADFELRPRARRDRAVVKRVGVACEVEHDAVLGPAGCIGADRGVGVGGVSGSRALGVDGDLAGGVEAKLEDRTGV